MGGTRKWRWRGRRKRKRKRYRRGLVQYGEGKKWMGGR